MQIAKNTVVSMDIELSDINGTLVERSEEPLVYLHGGYDNIFPLVEQTLEGHKIGDALKVRLEPEEAFGEYDEKLVRLESRERFPEVLDVGMQFEGIPGDAAADDGEATIYTVTDIAEGKVVLDGNHPLAGMALDFSCTVTGVRAASEEEIDHGHVHDPDGEGLHVAH
jgi:FKBP-type peptidyl-prolyl cis-trans isomerase SlyD